ncbi:zinc-binding dehydrogenase [Gordonia sp. (in: high G+C Gram-positive bacteria)]|uniref:zinc-binding dehydrogenase n=1 Tax=Gordonia sp. (in: high G+C Gram-positive bacteria) TaxID=84139 RepID=UPI0035292DF8
MKATVCSRGEFEVTDLPVPEPGRRQVLLKVLRAGICGSDLHARLHCDDVAELTGEVGYDDFMRSDQRVVLGHEFVGEVAAYGPGCRRRWKPGTRVVSLPIRRDDGEMQMTGLSARAPGAFAEYVLVEEDVTMPVPDGLDTGLAALTEPLAVGYHAVARSEIGRGEVAVVVGCGPIGLAVILMLKARGIKTVVASDLSPARRALATTCGADIVVDPARQDLADRLPPRAMHFRRGPDMLDFAVEAMHRLQAVPGLPWWRLMGLGEWLGQVPKGPVVFECVGVPGMLDKLGAEMPYRSRIVVVGVCMEPDTLRPALLSNKEIDLRFAFAYDPDEFRATLHLLADGKIDARPLLTGTVGLGGVDAAFAALGDPDGHAKILIDPASEVVSL